MRQASDGYTSASDWGEPLSAEDLTGERVSAWRQQPQPSRWEYRLVMAVVLLLLAAFWAGAGLLVAHFV